MDAVWSVIEDHHGKLSSCGDLERKRREQRQAWLWTMIDDGLKRHFLSRPDVKRLLPEMEAAVASASLTPTQAARRLLSLLDVEREEAQRPASRRKRSA
jgi:LAO/AO transport system kinase